MQFTFFLFYYWVPQDDSLCPKNCLKVDIIIFMSRSLHDIQRHLGEACQKLPQFAYGSLWRVKVAARRFPLDESCNELCRAIPSSSQIYMTFFFFFSVFTPHSMKILQPQNENTIFLTKKILLADVDIWDGFQNRYLGNNVTYFTARQYYLDLCRLYTKQCLALQKSRISGIIVFLVYHTFVL